MEATTMPTEEFTTELGTKVVVKSAITGFENRKLQDAYLDVPSDMKQSEKMHIVTDTALRTVVISINGQTEDIPTLVLNLDNRDTQEIIKRVNEITADKKKQMSNSVT